MTKNALNPLRTTADLQLWLTQNGYAKPDTLAQLRWFLAIQNARANCDCNNLKDWAVLFLEGIPAIKDGDIQEWLDMHHEDECAVETIEELLQEHFA